MGRVSAYLNDDRHEDGQALGCEACQEVTQHSGPDPPVCESLDEVSARESVPFFAMGNLLRLHASAGELAFGVGEVPRRLGIFGKPERRNEAENDGNAALEDEEVLPRVERALDSKTVSVC